MRLKKGSKSVDGFVRGGADDATMAIGLGALLWLIGFARLLPVSGNLAIRPNEFKLRHYPESSCVAARPSLPYPAHLIGNTRRQHRCTPFCAVPTADVTRSISAI